MQQLAIGALEIAWDQRGVSEPALMLVHGYTGSSTDFVDHLDYFAQKRRVLTIDQRGHGQSGHGPLGEYTFARLTDDLIAVIEVAAPGPVHILGHSMGGRIAMQTAITRPDLVRSLILTNTFAAGFDDPWSHVRTITDQLRIRGMAFLDEDPYAEPGDWHLTDESLKLRRANRDVLDVEAFIGLAREMSTAPPVLEQMAALDIPTTIIVGRRDTMRKASKSLAAVMPSATLHQIRRAYHHPQLSHSDTWRALVEGHLDNVALAGR